MTPIVIHRFSQRDSAHYRAYLEVKREVFGDPRTGQDEFDHNARFLLATLPDRALVGIVRGLPLGSGLPHRSLLEQYLDDPEVAAMLPRLCTLSDLGVRAPFRARDFYVAGSHWIGTVGRLLLLAMIGDLERLGMEAAIVTATSPISRRLCEGIGFLPLGPPPVACTAARYGLVFGSPRHVNAERLCGMDRDPQFRLSAGAQRLQKYFQSQQEQPNLAAAGRT